MKQIASHIDINLNRIAGCTRYITDDGTFVCGQRIEQRGLARVRATCNYNRKTFSHYATVTETVCQLFQAFLGRDKIPADLKSILRTCLFLIPIHKGFEECENTVEFVQFQTYCLRQAAAQLGEGQFCLLFRFSVDQIHHGLCLCQIHLATDECPLAELAGFSRTRTVIDQAVQNCLSHCIAAMAGYLIDIFAGIGMGRTEGRQNYFINFRPDTGGHCIAFHSGRQGKSVAIGPKEPVADGSGFRP